MKRLRVRLLIGLAVAIALALGASPVLKAAAEAAGKAATKATGKAAIKATATLGPTADAVLPSTPLPGTTGAEVAAAGPQAGKAKAPKSTKPTRDQVYVDKFKRIAPSQQQAAVTNARLKGLKPGVAGLAQVGIAAVAAPLPGLEGPGGVPHYFGPYGNWAFSPVPRGPIARVVIQAGGTGYNNPIVIIDDAYGTGASTSIPTTQLAGVVQAPAIATPVGANFSAPVATVIDDPARCGGAAQPACGTGALADALVGGAVAGGLRKFVDSLPGLGPAAANNLGQYIPVGVPDTTTYAGSDYYEIAVVEYTQQMHSDLPGPHNPSTPGALGTKLRGYVQLETPANAATSLHVPLPGGRFGYDNPHYLGPVIVAHGRTHGIQVAGPDPGDPRPVRIKFYNLLPTGVGGDLFLPVDDTIPGAGAGAAGGNYTQNRATIHLHGNNTVWISDGNTHQWITPAGESTAYPAGVSARNVPDMGTSCDGVGTPGRPGGSGCMTFFYTNAQSARLQFYHDHAHGITRLNVYAGEAAGYVVTDAAEADMINGTNVTGVNPGLLHVLPPDNGGLGIPLVIQDKTFVDADTVFAQDPTWNWGTGPKASGRLTAAVTGDLWYPHVYMTVTNPWDVTGTSPVGRWFYGPWFSPPTPVCVAGGPVGCIETGPVPNEYYDPINRPWEPPLRPGIPNPSIPGESFLDTQLVNGTVYPYLEVEPRAYRFRVLNASNDRMLNLQLYKAYDKTSFTPGTGSALPGTPTVACTTQDAPGTANPLCTEVKMVPVSALPANQFADTPSGVPDPTTAGPAWIQIGTEGGLMPAPVVVPQQPIGYNLDPAYFNFGVVNQHSLFLGAAERADVVVDFSTLAGQTLILYNDSPAPVPAGAVPYDFFTGDGNLMSSGGAPNTLPGFGPNTRTIMQIRVKAAATTPTPDVTLANLQAVFAKGPAKRGVFEVTQDPIVIPQTAYNSAYNNTFPSDASQFILNLGDTAKTFQPIDQNGILQPTVTIPLEMKAMHDEMGGVYDTMFGRMSGMLGLTNPTSAVHVLIPYSFSAPPTDIVKGSLEATPIGQLADGTQLWRIFHNGVDTHPIHTHLFHAQLISRVGQDGQVAPGPYPSGQAVDASDLGWKDTFKVNPLEMTFLALRPTVPTPDQVPFEVPNSTRLIDPTLPDGAVLPPPAPAGWFDPAGNAITQILNHTVNFGWEYVWHCHILSHEEMDFMHSLAFAVPPRAATNLVARSTGTATNRRITVTWTDNSTQETGYRLERATDPTFATITRTVLLPSGTGTMSFVDGTAGNTLANNTVYFYRVWAVGPTIGDIATAGFPTMAADSVSNMGFAGVGTAPPPLPPTNLAGAWSAGPPVAVALSWTDNSTDETSFAVERCAGSNCSTFAAITTTVPAHAGTGTVTYNDTTVTSGTIYSYRVRALRGAAVSAYSNIVANLSDPGVSGIPVPPSALTASSTAAGVVTLNWTHPGGASVLSFTIQRATNASFTTSVASITVAANLRTAQETLTVGASYYYRIAANGSAGASAWANATPFPLAVGAAARKVFSEFTGDTKSDILWWHNTTGAVYLWAMNGTAMTLQSYVSTVADTNFEIRGVGDQDGNGGSDILWRNKTTGAVYFWSMSAGAPTSQTLVSTVSTAFDIVGTGDYDGDGKSDILWRNSTTGDLYLWLMNGATVLSQTYVSTVSTVFAVVGSGDLNGDGKADILWRNQTTGDVYAWLMNGATPLSYSFVATVADTGFQVSAVADFTGDGNADIVWRHATRGDVWLWTMSGATVQNSALVAVVADTNFQIAGKGDYNGDGMADLLWHHATTGQTYVWLMNGATMVSSGLVGTVADVGFSPVNPQ